MNRRQLVRSATAGAAALAFPVLRAQPAWPSQPVKLLISFAAGGSTDAMFRVLAENASALLGQQVLVEPRPGAGGTLAPMQLLNAKADGYTLAQVPLSFFRVPYLQKVSWDPARDIAYVLNITGYSFGTAVPAESPIRSWADYIAWAKANPGKLSYATSGMFTTPHLTAEEIAHRLGLELNHVPFKGIAEIMQNILGGNVMSVSDSLGYAPHVQSGKLRLLCTWGDKRVAKFPEVPTLTELGLPIVQASPYGLAAPKGTDAAVLKRLHDVFKRAMEMPNHVEMLAKFDQELIYMSGEQYSRFAEDTYKRERAVVERLRAQGKLS